MPTSKVEQMVPDQATNIFDPRRKLSHTAFLTIIRHQLPTILSLTALSIVLSLIYVFLTVPTYTATASLLTDIHNPQLFDPEANRRENPLDLEFVPSQIEVLKSQNVSLAVIKTLHLIEDPEFVSPKANVIGVFFKFVSSYFQGESASSKSQLQRQVVALFESMRTVTRVGQTYVVDISFRSTDPEKAARIANAIADAYIDDLLEARYQGTRRSSLWLQDRLKDLRNQVSAQENAAVLFRKENNIVNSDNGRLMIDQQLAEINSQIIAAQANTAEARARYERVRQLLKDNIPDASVADALKNAVIIKLREQYVDMASHEALWSEKYGAKHLATVNLQNQMREIKRSIGEEMSKIEQSYKVEYEIAQEREKSIAKQLLEAVSRSQITSQAEIKLEELESAAKTSKSLHDNIAQRFMEAIQQQSFPNSEARVLTIAVPPLSKSHPRLLIIMPLSLAAGLSFGLCLASLREMMDRVVRSSEQVEAVLGVSCLAMVPYLKKASPASASNLIRSKETQPTCSPYRSPPTLPRGAPSLLDYVLREPYSQFSDALRNVKVASDLSRIVKTKMVTGITSTLPREGKTTIAANYAKIIAQTRSRTILIDADLRNPTLSRQIATDDRGLLDVLMGSKSIEDAVFVDPRTGLTILPAGPRPNVPHTNEILASNAMKELIEVLRKSYDYVITDLPPMIRTADVRASVRFIDAFIYVVEWGHTKIDAAQFALTSAPEIYERLLGVIVNKIDVAAINRYERYLNSHYDRKYAAFYNGKW
jgi:polysaccharide biosynthesis transport protein